MGEVPSLKSISPFWLLAIGLLASLFITSGAAKRIIDALVSTPAAAPAGGQ